MKLGDVLKKERNKKDLTAADVAEKLAIPEREYRTLEDGESPAEKWGMVLAQIAIQLETPTSRLLAESGRFADCRPGQAGTLIRRHRERRELDADDVARRIEEAMSQWDVSFSADEYRQIEAGKSPIEIVGPQLLGFAEAIEQPVFNLFYPCGLPFSELDDYP